MSLDEFVRGEEVVDFEGGGVRGVRAVGAVIADAGAEVMADGAGGGFLGVGGAHGLAPFGDGALGFKDQGNNFARGHEVGERGEEGTLTMDGVEAAGFVFSEAHGFDGYDFETGFMNANQNVALQAATDRIRLDNCESSFESQNECLQKKDKVASKVPALLQC